jgi:hypothetical protein
LEKGRVLMTEQEMQSIVDRSNEIYRRILADEELDAWIRQVMDDLYKPQLP